MSEPDKANYVGLLVAQILRPYLRTITSFGMVSATTQSSGKTLLTEGIGLLCGQNTPTWGRDDAELRKVITAMLGSAAAVIVWDNLKEGTAIDSPVLAQLLTSPTWSDRTLGSNRTFTAANDRLWLATGNNLRIGGDMATRTVLVRLDRKMPRPKLRTNFTIPNPMLITTRCSGVWLGWSRSKASRLLPQESGQGAQVQRRVWAILCEEA